MKPAVAVDRKKVRPPAAVAVGAPDIGHPRYAGDVFSDPEKTAASDLVTGSDVASGLHDPRGLQRRRLRPYPPGCSQRRHAPLDRRRGDGQDRKSTRLNSSHMSISYAVFCLKKKKKVNFFLSYAKQKKIKSNK